jgi:hypothetical protein
LCAAIRENSLLLFHPAREKLKGLLGKIDESILTTFATDRQRIFPDVLDGERSQFGSPKSSTVENGQDSQIPERFWAKSLGRRSKRGAESAAGQF